MERERIEVSDGSVKDSQKNNIAWLGWLAVIVGLVSLVYSPLILGIAAILLGLISLSRSTALGWSAIILGAIAIIARWFFHGGY